MPRERIDDGAEGGGIEAPRHINAQPRVQVDANPGTVSEGALGFQLDESLGIATCRFPEAPTPGVEKVKIDPALSAVCCSTDAACCVGVDDCVPVGSPFCSCHLLAPGMKLLYAREP